jgi:serine phosphatase RsbU (regulator of sigma subunit)
MALTRSLVYAEAKREPSPRVVLNRVHRLLLELSARNMFVTIFYGVIDTPTRTLTYVRAGHDRPLLVRKGGIEPLEGRGTALGFLEVEEPVLEQEQLELEPGDRLVLYTDGLIDAYDTRGRAFGLEGLTRSIEMSAESDLEQMCRTIFDRVKAFQEGTAQYDDMTLLVVQVQ